MKSKKDLKCKILKYLADKSPESSDPTNLLRDLSLDIPVDSFNQILEEMKLQGFIKIHKQSRSGSAPKYDLVFITESGKKLIIDSE